MRRARSFLIVIPAVALSSAALILSFMVGTDILSFSISSLLLMAVGTLIVLKARGNLVGIVLTVGGAAWLLYTAAGAYARLSLDSGPLPGEYLSAWLGSWVGAILPVSLAALILLFPNGKVPPGWRWLAVVLGLVVSIALFGGLILWGLPAQVLADFDALDQQPSYIWIDTTFGAGFLAVVPAVIALIQRYRSGTWEQRQQIKWLIAATGSFIVIFATVIAASLDVSGGWDWLIAVGIGFVPVAVGLAVFRYRLYDIDTFISRTVTYGLVVALIGLVIFGLVATMAIFLPSDDPLLVALATLVAFALFNPLRRRVQVLADRRFNRARYDVVRVNQGFSEKLRDQTDSDRVVDGWVGVVAETMQPTTVGVWVRE